MSRFLGILRERVYSPGKIDDDRAILETVAATLATDHDVRVVSADDSLPDPPRADVVFTMAQGPAALRAMRRWQAQGIRVINTSDAIENCHRRRMTAAFARAGVHQPSSLLTPTAATDAPPEWIATGAWIKRGDVHATHPDDVVYVTDPASVAAALAAFHRRGIADAIIQRHVPGTAFKFYGVWQRYFRGFLGAESDEQPSAHDLAALRALAEQGAAALGVEIFGGDCVLQPDGVPVLIDLNDWPSYGRCRLDAAHAIATYIATSTR